MWMEKERASRRTELRLSGQSEVETQVPGLCYGKATNTRRTWPK